MESVGWISLRIHQNLQMVDALDAHPPYLITNNYSVCKFRIKDLCWSIFPSRADQSNSLADAAKARQGQAASLAAPSLIVAQQNLFSYHYV